MAKGHLIKVVEDDGWAVGVLPNGEKVKFSPGARDNLVQRVGRSNVVGTVVRAVVATNTSEDMSKFPWFVRNIETLDEERDFNAAVRVARKQPEAEQSAAETELQASLEALIDQMTPEITDTDGARRLLDIGENPLVENWFEMVRASTGTIRTETREMVMKTITTALHNPSVRTTLINFKGSPAVQTQDDEEEDEEVRGAASQ